MGKTFRLGAELRYPITITRISSKVGDEVQKQQAILQYTFNWQRTVGDPDLGEEHTVTETTWADWDCPTEGKIQRWRVKEGDVIERDLDLVTIEEACPHSVQYAGLCALCGKDMTESNWATEERDADRATIAMVHDNVGLKVSREQAEKAEMSLQKRLLMDRKLSLVVDLDQTVIHACIEPTIGEWQSDPSNPNYDSVKDVRSFQLDDGPRGLASGCWYYIKMRPGLAEFLDRVAEMFELHIYTMGTRAYALNIAKIIDPTQKLFGNRLISRDENGSMTAKSLQRLFPVSTNMVVVIDDRADVWPHNRPNLIKVTPYDFFKGIGDINSSFLPKREDVISPSPAPDLAPKVEKGQPDKSPAPVEGAAAAASQDGNNTEEDALLQQQAEEQERTLEKQLTDRPLLHLQEKLDKEDEEAEKDTTPPNDSTGEDMNGHSEAQSQQARHNLLRDDDEELIHLERHLSNLHNSFYEQFDARSANQQQENMTSDVVPNVGATLNYLKSQVLKGTRMVLSGIVPMGTDVRSTEIGMQAESFGTEIHTRVSKDITHLVISSSRPRTTKVRQAAVIPSIKIVNQDWLADSLAQWKKLDERPYLIPIHPADRVGASGGDGSASKAERPKILIRSSGTDVVDYKGAGEEGGAESDFSSSNDGDGGEDEDTDGEVRDRYNVMPRQLEAGESSPVDGLQTMEWANVNAELDDFLGSDAEDSEDESTVAGDTDADEPSSAGSTKGTKRKLGDGEDESNDDEAEGGSALSKKQRLAKARTTGLRNVKNATEDEDGGDDSGLPTPIPTGDEYEQHRRQDLAEGKTEAATTTVTTGEDDGENEDDDEDDDFDLQAELEAELNAD